MPTGMRELLMAFGDTLALRRERSRRWLRQLQRPAYISHTRWATVLGAVEASSHCRGYRHTRKNVAGYLGDMAHVFWR
jgi:hypothetical protein